MEQRVGVVVHYYNRIGVAVVHLTGKINIGDLIHICGRTTEFSQVVRSIEIDHLKVKSAEPGQEIALQVLGRVRKGDSIYLVKALITQATSMQ